MENAEGVRTPGELDEWWHLGVRIIGPAWAGTRFCGGTLEPGPLTSEGYALLDGMADLGFMLDLSHMDEKAVLQALDHYPGAIIASHSNAKNLLADAESNRFLSDEVIYGLIERNGTIGIVPFNRFLDTSWKSTHRRQAITLEHVVSQIDHVCQLAGSAQHVGIGSDFDGGFGLQSVPAEIDTIADLQKLIPLLAEKRYTNSDVSAIMGENWLSLLRRISPEEA
jgi:membrane dipeptidase